jgi:5-methyltetrahydrofolate--homocysteine methyltransferase
MDIKAFLQHNIAILDGAMGTMIQRYKLSDGDFDYPGTTKPLKGNNDILSLTRPHIIKEIHLQYLDAGAHIIETNTFNANSVSQEDYDLGFLAPKIAYESVVLAKQAVAERSHQNRPAWVAGAVGPTNKTLSMSPDVNDPGYRAMTFDELVAVYVEQIQAMKDAHVDLILIETIFDTLNAKAAVMASRRVCKDLPIMISGTITDASGRTLSGQNTEAFYISLEHAKPLSIGLNCALGADLLLPYLERLHKVANCFISAYPNAGLPNEMGDYDQSAEQMTEQLKPYIQNGLVNIIGGCCGSTPDHIRAIANAVTEYETSKKIS